MTDDLPGVRVARNPFVPEGMLVVINDDAFTVYPDVVWREDPWPDFSPGRLRGGLMGVSVWERERQRALDHLARELDRACESYGWSPDAVWRDPKLAEKRDRADRTRFMLEARIGMSILDPSAPFRFTI